MDIFPDELFIYIFSFFRIPTDKLVVTRVCQRWRRIGFDGSLWREAWLGLRHAVVLANQMGDKDVARKVVIRAKVGSAPDALRRATNHARDVYGFDFSSLAGTVREVRIEGQHGEALTGAMNLVASPKVTQVHLIDCDLELESEARRVTIPHTRDGFEARLGLSKLTSLVNFSYERRGDDQTVAKDGATILDYLFSLRIPLRRIWYLGPTRRYLRWMLEDDPTLPGQQTYAPATLREMYITNGRMVTPMNSRRFPNLEVLVMPYTNAEIFEDQVPPPLLRVLSLSHTETLNIDFPNVTQLTLYVKEVTEKIRIDIRTALPKCRKLQIGMQNIEWLARNMDWLEAVLRQTTVDLIHLLGRDPPEEAILRAEAAKRGMALQISAGSTGPEPAQRVNLKYSLLPAQKPQ